MYDSLYNPNYGYFSKRARIFSPPNPFQFPGIKNSLAYDRLVADAINQFEDSFESEQNPSGSRQVFHTPTELFKPYYGEALARHLLHQYRIHYYPHSKLSIYEIGGGNGTLMLNILDYIREHDPQVYNYTEYRTIEISPQLAMQQRQNIEKSKFGKEHAQHVEIVQKDVLTWNVPVRQPCYVLAMEVIDNFPHDVIRYDPTTGRPMQGIVLINEDGEFEETYSGSMDELSRRYLSLREKLGYQHLPRTHPQRTPSIVRRALHSLPYTGKLTPKEFIPTTLLVLLDVLKEYFPHHHLLLSDFDSLPNAIPGYMSPVVQTRYQRSMVPCTTYLVQQGYFDIFFPTNFEELRGLYGMLCPSYFGTRRTQVVTHKYFMERWGDLKATTTKSGENPMTDYYQNVRMLVS
jgi:Putative S-adenosyl-L-methionine-dependent methyltransferase